MEMDRETRIRTAIAFALCGVILFGWQFFLAPKPAPTPAPADNAAAVTPLETAPHTLQPDGSVQPVGTNATPQTSALPIVVEMPDYTIAFDPNSGDVRLVSITTHTNEDGAHPTFTRVGTEDNYATFDAGISSGFSYVLETVADGKVVTFTAENQSIRVIKQYRLKNDEYHIPMELIVENLTGVTLRVPIRATVGPGLGRNFEQDRFVFMGPIIRNERKTERKAEDKIKNDIALENPLWGAFTSKYFLFAVFAEGFDTATITKYGSSAKVELNGSIDVKPNEIHNVYNLAIYAGPKYFHTLRAFGNQLQKTIDYGIFAFLAVPMALLLKFFYGYVGNYGVAIIMITIVMKIVTLPLTLKSMRSMKRMTKLQPEMVALRDKFKDDPAKLNTATMELYRKHKVNPLSGCLPMLAQLPIFFALYKALLVSIELKGAPFIFWITDLSVQDPYYITPVLMGATMFLQQWLTPTTIDPMQKKIFMAMPVVFTFLFLTFPAGLVLYWLVNNILTIGQQFAINKMKD